MSTPWFPFAPVWEWSGVSPRHAERARAYFVRKADVLEMSVSAKGCRHIAELRSYTLCIEKMHDLSMFSTDHLAKYDVVRQLRHSEMFRRHDAIGKRIAAGTWPKRTGIERTNFLTDEDLARTAQE